MKINEQNLFAFFLEEWFFKARGGRLESFLKATREYFGECTYKTIWEVATDFWECVGADNRLDVRGVELLAEQLGLDFHKLPEWEYLKKEGKKYVC